MDQVAGDHRVLAAPAQRDGVMIDRVARRRDQRDQIVQRMIAGDQVAALRLDDRDDAVGDRRHASSFVVLRQPEIQLGLREQVAGLGEGRHPAAVLQPRVPADMIDMKMRAKNEIDVVHASARRRPGPA